MILRQRLKPRVALDLTPLIDVVFQLLVFFMISSVFNTAPGIELTLPQSDSSEAVEVSALRITVVSPEEIYLNRDLLALESLGETLREWENQGRIDAETTLTIEGDGTVSYQTIVRVLDQVRRGGMDGVNLITHSPPEES